ncbi:MAG: N-acetylmannosamine-6-phosphate 2-epimerase [Acholeplasmatales bacterium]|jgi:N-acylglucosamine-6-phosphate 2-epimerase|nr:N-acetylmannosamine-6-phosphate 2-epimerase [Acholeplasmataceae bacterium]MCK9427874.1 N-acetylmannosamine-6-phosphate 2-epimerase [Acholeplasmataceae bacterium]MDY0114988.1 N-acetylmannosamine-6-phosphate 2-epimerase [Acholeplasmatales bacterium]
MKKVLDKMKEGLIVSCQALENEPLFGSVHMKQMALAAQIGGAAAIRANSVVDIVAIKGVTDLPIIGLIKRKYKDSSIYITPTIKEIDELLDTGCEIIALDATNRKSPEKLSLKERVRYIHEKGRLAMADVSNYQEALQAQKDGFDIISTTLSGYTDGPKVPLKPDFKLVNKLVKTIDKPIFAEGRIRNIGDIKKMRKQNPFAIVVGSAITRPQEITKWFVEALK